MKIAFFTEMGFSGQIPRTHNNMRTEFAWMVALNAVHFPLNSIPNESFDLGIVITPKNSPESVQIENLKPICNKIAIMQEGPNWYWQDYTLDKQVHYFNNLQKADFIFVHNENDKKYYSGLTGKECIVLPSLMIEDSIKDLPKVDREGVIIGGNFCSWYGGFDSYIIAQEADCPIYIPSMGRKIEGEEQMPNLNHLPYMNWVEWIKTLNQFKYGVHLMRTHAAGTFALNCAYLGIPCIGYKGLDTQEKCHPNLTVDVGNLEGAKHLITLLKENQQFYNKCALEAQENYQKYYNEKIFLKQFKL
jgi:hypothetical protein